MKSALLYADLNISFLFRVYLLPLFCLFCCKGDQCSDAFLLQKKKKKRKKKKKNNRIIYEICSAISRFEQFISLQTIPSSSLLPFLLQRGPVQCRFSTVKEKWFNDVWNLFFCILIQTYHFSLPHTFLLSFAFSVAERASAVPFLHLWQIMIGWTNVGECTKSSQVSKKILNNINIKWQKFLTCFISFAISVAKWASAVTRFH